MKTKASWALFACVRNMAAHSSVIIISGRLYQCFTKKDIPGASLQGRNPTTLKSDELHFSLKYHGDPAKGFIKNKGTIGEKGSICRPDLE